MPGPVEACRRFRRSESDAACVDVVARHRILQVYGSKQGALPGHSLVEARSSGDLPGSGVGRRAVVVDDVVRELKLTRSATIEHLGAEEMGCRAAEQPVGGELDPFSGRAPRERTGDDRLPPVVVLLR